MTTGREPGLRGQIQAWRRGGREGWEQQGAKGTAGKLLVLHRARILRPSLPGKAETWLRILKPLSYFYRMSVNSRPEKGQLASQELLW